MTVPSCIRGPCACLQKFSVAPWIVVHTSPDLEWRAVFPRAESEQERDGLFDPRLGGRVPSGGFAEKSAEQVSIDDSWSQGNGGHARGQFLGESAVKPSTAHLVAQ